MIMKKFEIALNSFTTKNVCSKVNNFATKIQIKIAFCLSVFVIKIAFSITFK